MSSIEDRDSVLPSLLDPMPFGIGRESNKRFRDFFSINHERLRIRIPSLMATEFFVPHEDNPMLAEDNLQMTEANMDFEALEPGMEIGRRSGCSRITLSMCLCGKVSGTLTGLMILPSLTI